MKKKFIALVVGAAAVMPAVALADVSVYGRAHVSVDWLDDGDDYSEVNLSSNSSRLGFKGSHEINKNLKAFFQIEQQINFNTGPSDGGSDFATRDTFVGLSGSAGAVQLGRFDSPFKAARGPANLFGDQLGDMRNLTRVGNGRFDERYDNTVQYTSPTFGGFNAKLAYSVYEGEFAEDGDNSDAVSLSLNYAAGPIEAALAYEQVEEDHSRGERDALRAALAYKLGKAVKLVGFYQTTDHDSPNPIQRDQWTFDVYGLGGEFKVASNTALKAMWLTHDSDADDRDADMWVVGIEHKLDSSVRIYANYAMVDNDENQSLTPWRQARTTDQPGVADEKASGFSLGLRYDF